MHLHFARLGLAFAVVFLGYQTYHAFRISEGLRLTESLIPEIVICLVNFAIFALPGIFLLLRTNIGPLAQKLSPIYPLLLGFGVANVLLADDALAAGLSVQLVVMPFCLLYAVFTFFSNDN